MLRLSYSLTRWALVRELVRKDGVTPALAQVNHRLERTGLRLDFHFAPTRPSLGHPSSSRPSTNEHWWRVPEAERATIVISDSDVEEKTIPCRCGQGECATTEVAVEKASTSAPAVTTTATTAAAAATTTTATPAAALTKVTTRGVKRKTDQ